MSTETKQTTVGDVVSKVGQLAKRGVEAIREGGTKLQKADLSPAHVKETVANTPVNKLVYWCIIVFAAFAAYAIILKPLLKKGFR